MSMTIAKLVEFLAENEHPKSAAMVRYYLTSRDIQPAEKIGSASLYADGVADQLLAIVVEADTPKPKAEKPAKEEPAEKPAPKTTRTSRAKKVEEPVEAPAPKKTPTKRAPAKKAAPKVEDDFDDLDELDFDE